MADFGFNTNIPLGATVPRTSLSDMVNMASGITNLQQAQQLQPVQLEAARLQLQQAQQMNPLLLRSQQAETQVGENTARPRITQAEQAANTAIIATQKAQLGLDDAQAQIAYSQGGALLGDKRIHSAADNPADAFEAIADARDRMILNGVPRAKAEAIVAPFMTQVTRSPQTLVQSLTNAINAASGATAISEKVNRAPTQVGTGQTTELIPTSPLQLGQPRQSVGMELPPTTELTAVEGNPYGLPPGTRYLLGPQGQAMIPRPTAPAARPAQPSVTGLAPSVSGALATSTQVAGEDWKSTVADSLSASSRVPILQTMRNLSDEAFTGTAAERQRYIAGLAGLIGIDAGELASTATDELKKNTSLLALAGGNTDAARALAEAANPNMKMNAPAIKGVINQLIGMERLKVKKAEFLAPFQSDVRQYGQKLLEFTNAADYRMFQEMTPAEFAKAKNSMSPAERKEMDAKIAKAKSLGLI